VCVTAGTLRSVISADQPGVTQQQGVSMPRQPPRSGGRWRRGLILGREVGAAALAALLPQTNSLICSAPGRQSCLCLCPCLLGVLADSSRDKKQCGWVYKWRHSYAALATAAQGFPHVWEPTGPGGQHVQASRRMATPDCRQDQDIERCCTLKCCAWRAVRANRRPAECRLGPPSAAGACGQQKIWHHHMSARELRPGRQCRQRRRLVDRRHRRAAAAEWRTDCALL
jgi:hypothetical protein